MALRATKPRVVPANDGRSPPAIGRSRPGSYRRILVPLIDSRESEKALTIACQLAAEHGALITALTAIEVPAELPIDAHMDDEEQCARELLKEAQAICELYGVAVAPRIVRAREAGTAIIDAAHDSRAEIVILRAPRKPRASVFGRSVDTILKHAPCRVMIAASSADQ